MASIHEFTTAQLRQALEMREQIETLQGKLSALLGGGGGSTASAAPVAKRGPGRPKGPQVAKAPKGKRKMSAAGRAAIAAAQKARWAKLKGGSTSAAAPVEKAPKKRKRKGMTPERRAKLAASMRAAWAARKKASGG